MLHPAFRAPSLVGTTWSTEKTFPVRQGPGLRYAAWGDGFVAKVNPQGTGLVFCGYLGGFGIDYGRGVAVDRQGNVYFVGEVASTEYSFPVVGGPDLTHNGGYDAAVAKIGPQGRRLFYCGYIGGPGQDRGYGIAVDGAGHAYVVGETDADERNFPVRLGPDLTYNGNTDAFVAKVVPSGTGCVYCGYIGGGTWERARGVAVDASGAAYVIGDTTSDARTFPVRGGPFLRLFGGSDAFVAKVWAPTASLSASGRPVPGGRVQLALSAPGDGGAPYRVASALGAAGIPVDLRLLGLSPDPLFWLSLQGGAPAVFSGYAGKLDAAGRGQAAIRIPATGGLAGLTVYTAFVTLGAGAPSGVRSISETLVFTIGP